MPFKHALLEHRDRSMSSGAAATAPSSTIAIPDYLHSVLHRIYFVTEPSPVVSLEQALLVLEKAVQAPSRESDPEIVADAPPSHRAVPENVKKSRCYPRELESRVYLRLKNYNTNAAPPLTMVYAEGLYFLGVGVEAVSVPPRTVGEVPSTAFFKMSEVVSRYLSWGTERYVGRRAALDVGAAPGGWTWCLAKTLGIRHCLAVDPGELDARFFGEASSSGRACQGPFGPEIPIAVRGRVCVRGESAGGAEATSPRNVETPLARQVGVAHWRMKGEEAVRALLRNGAPRPAGPQQDEEMARHRFAVYVSDVNSDLESTVDLFELALPLLELPALCVLTFKNTCNTLSDWDKRKAAGVARLREMGLRDVREMHLFANTLRETTVIGEVVAGEVFPPRPPSP